MRFFKKYRDLSLIAVAGVIGYFCMTHSPALPVTALIIPILWILANKRVSAFFVVLTYHLSISRGVVQGAAVFLSETHTLTGAFILWILMSLGTSVPFFIFWSSKKHKKILCLSAALIFAYILPPISLIGVMNPMMMTGCLFPGWGWYGLSAMLLIYFLCVIDLRLACILAVIIPLLPAFGLGALNTPKNPAGFLAVNTSFGRLGSGSANFLEDFNRFQIIFSNLKKMKINDFSENYIILPETIAGRLNKPGFKMWMDELKQIKRADQEIIFGGEIPTDSGKKYDNVMILTDTDKTVSIPQRIPVPYSMYYGPFAEFGANIHLWQDGIMALPDGRKAAVIICYESYLSLPYIMSLAQNPDMILCSANIWWCKETSLPLIQERSVALWAQLFDLPALLVKNL